MTATATKEESGTAFENVTAGADEPEEKEEGALFDKKVYDGPLALPQADGQDVDRIALKFSGTVFLDRSDERDVTLMKKLALGRDVTLMIEGKSSRKIEGFNTDREGELDVVVLSRAVKVHTVCQPVGVVVDEDPPADAPD